MKNWCLYLGLLLTCIQMGLSDDVYAADSGITADQLIQLNKLTTQQRADLLNMLNRGKSSSGQSTVSPSPSSSPPPSPSSSIDALHPKAFTPSTVAVTAESELPRIQGGDTLLIEIHPPPVEGVEALGGRLPEKRIFVLDEAGGLTIPNFGRVILAGLTNTQAAERITAEPAFEGYSVQVTLLPVEQELKPFGYDLFQSGADTFAPVTDIPIPSDYVVGPGDNVAIQLFGKENAQYELVITRDGTLLFPGIGPVSIAGMTFSQLQQDIQNRVQKQLIGVQASVTLGRLRSIRIFVLGDVQQAGSYTVSGLSTLTNALFASGGVKMIGSLRDIQLKRQGKIITHLDLYDLLLQGDTRSDARLLPGDVIFVPPIGNVAGISGGVRRPAIYELKDEKSIDDLIIMAGGLLPDAYPQDVQIERIHNNSERSLIDIDLTSKGAGSINLQDGDIVRVHSILDKVNRVVTLSGYVQRPGTYQWSPGMRLTDLITSMSQTLSDVDGRYLLIKREDTVERTLELLSANLVAALQKPDSDANLALQPLDEIIVFDIHGDRSTVLNPLLEQVRAQSAPDKPVQEVTIQGTVHHPGVYPLSPGMKISDLLLAAGGLTDRAYTLNAELTRFAVVDGEFREQSLQTFNLEKILTHQADDIMLNAYDQISIRRVPNWSKEGSIEIIGEVRFPGVYPVARGEKLSEIIERAGGVTSDAYPQGAIFLRESIRQQWTAIEADHLPIAAVAQKTLKSSPKSSH